MAFKTTLPDDISGRIIEYLWHSKTQLFNFKCLLLMKFSNIWQRCGALSECEQCYCDVYGICDVDCESEGVCRDQYTLPKFSVIPDGWPEYGWDGNWQNVTRIRLDPTGDLGVGE